MMSYEELMSCLTGLGRGNLHDFIVRSHDGNDVITHLWVELGFDLARVPSFETSNFVTFEKKEFLKYTRYQANNQGHPSISQNMTQTRISQAEG
jgi:hypothetical protein